MATSLSPHPNRPAYVRRTSSSIARSIIATVAPSRRAAMSTRASTQVFVGCRRNRRIAAAAKFALPYMNVTSLLSWRCTSRDNHACVGHRLRSTLLILVSRFFPDPIAFLNILTPWGALIVGEAALSHILQEPTLCDTNFEVAVGNLYFESFLDSLSRLFPLGSTLLSRLDKSSPEGFDFHRHVSRISEFRLTTGLYITVYESCTPSGCDVIAGSWTTALMNFVTAYSAGCAYPRLTFSNRALVCDTRLTQMDWSERYVQDRLAVYGFDSKYCPDPWLLFARDPSPSNCPVYAQCGKSLYVCPLQGRFFGDPGSLVLFYDGMSVDLDGLRDLCVPPYGPMAAWRLPSTCSCIGGCAERDPVLPPFTVSMLVHFAETYTKLSDPGDQFQCSSTKRLQEKNASHQRGRRYSI